MLLHTTHSMINIIWHIFPPFSFVCNPYSCKYFKKWKSSKNASSVRIIESIRKMWVSLFFWYFCMVSRFLPIMTFSQIICKSKKFKEFPVWLCWGIYALAFVVFPEYIIELPFYFVGVQLELTIDLTWPYPVFEKCWWG